MVINHLLNGMILQALKTNIIHPEIDGWKMKLFPFQMVPFFGDMFIFFRGVGVIWYFSSWWNILIPSPR